MIDEGYLAHVRTKCCYLCGRTPVDAHHTTNVAWRESKRQDETAAAICREDHQLIHNVGLGLALQKRGVPVARFVQMVTSTLAEYFTEQRRTEAL